MQITCKNTSCNNVYEIPNEWLGKGTTCPRCHYMFTATAPSTLDEIAYHKKEQQEIKAEQQRIKTIEDKIVKTSKIENLKDDQVSPNWLKKKIRLYNPYHETKYYEIEAVIDTRFKDTLALPKSVIEVLELTKEEDCGDYYFGLVTMELLKNPGIALVVPYVVEDITSHARIGTKTLEYIITSSKFPIGALILAIGSILLGLGWASVPFSIYNQDSQDLIVFPVIPGWELGSALMQAFFFLLPLFIGIVGIWLICFGSKQCFLAMKQYVYLKKEWKIFLKELDNSHQ